MKQFDTAKTLESATDPMGAAIVICQYDCESACNILASMSPLGAALLLCMLRIRAKTGDVRANQIVARVEALGLPCAKGVTNARNEMYRATGVFLP